MSVCDLAGGANKKQKPAPAKKPALAVATSIAETLAKKAKEEKQEEEKAAKEKKREEEKEGKKKAKGQKKQEGKQEEETRLYLRKRLLHIVGEKQEEETGEKKNEEKKQEEEKAVKEKKKEEEEEGKKADEKGKTVVVKGKNEVEEQEEGGEAKQTQNPKNTQEEPEEDVVPLGKPPAEQKNANVIKITANVLQTPIPCGFFSVTSLISTVMAAAEKKATAKGSVFPKNAVMAAGLNPLDHDPVDPAKTISDALMTRGAKHFIGGTALEKKACSVYVYARLEFQGMRAGTSGRRR